MTKRIIISSTPPITNVCLIWGFLDYIIFTPITAVIKWAGKISVKVASPPATPPFHPLPTAETHGSKWGRVKLFIGNLSIRWSLTLNVHACMLCHFRCVCLCQPYGMEPVRLLCPRDYPGMNTRVGGHALHQGSSWCRDQTHVSYVYLQGQECSLPLAPPGKPLNLAGMHT